MNIHVVAALHGNEQFGLKIAGRLQQLAIPKITVRIGHPEAIAKNKRFLQQDLNRSFGPTNDTIESALATDIKRELYAIAPDLIIDIHTSVSDVENVAIVGQHNSFLTSVATVLGMNAMVVMPPHLVATSLLGLLPDRSLSLEFGKNSRSDRLAQTITEAIGSLGANHATAPSAQLPIFEVYDTINKDFPGLKTIKNLEFNQQLNGYPFLAGPTTYQTIGGFLARKVS